MNVADLHRHEPYTAQAEESLDAAADRMNWHQVGALPVFEGQRRPTPLRAEVAMGSSGST